MAKAYSAENVWVVIPAYNEARYLPGVLKKVLTHIRHVVVVDDGSQDNTAQVAQETGVIVLQHRLNLGKGAALKTGCEYIFRQPQAQAIIMMDGDDQHDPSEIPLFILALNQSKQVVFGIRAEQRNMPWLKQKINRLSSYLTYLLFGEYVLDIPSGYKAFTKDAYQYLAWNATNYAVELEIVARMAKAKLAYTTVHIKTIYHDLDKGMTALDVLAIIRYLVVLRVTL